MTIFDNLNVWIKGVEASLVNFLSAFVPWCAPLAPAYLSYTHMINELGFPQWVALAVAFVVEGLGLATISTAMSFWSHNRKYTSTERHAPIMVPIAAFISYLAIIMTLNVLIEIAKIPSANLDIQWVRVVAFALLAFFSVPAAVTLAVRTQHKELIDELSEEREYRRLERRRQRVQVEQIGKVEHQVEQVHSKSQDVYDWLTANDKVSHWKNHNEVPSAREIVSEFATYNQSINPSSAQNGRDRWIRDREKGRLEANRG